MEDPITLQHRLFLFVSWQLQLGILGVNVYWVKEVLVEYTKGVWKVLIRLVRYVHNNAVSKITK